jgi:hypothetical protein
MSQENVRVENEVIRRWFWAFENDTAAFRATLHPEIEWFPIDENRRRLYGIEAALRNRNEWLETWDEHRSRWTRWPRKATASSFAST